ncbi:MAG: DUF1122 domain-containing protein [Dehalococcoidia bacterium]|nr:DUF1122 domain-containing protein [Dehalococcoidia bacterium]
MTTDHTTLSTASAAIGGGRSSPWRPLAGLPGHALGAIEGAEVGNGVTLAIEIGPRSKVGSDYFRAFLVSDALGRSTAPLLWGLINRGRFPGFNWVEVTDSAGRLPMESGDEVEIPEGIELQMVRVLGTLVPAGGHLMMEYDSRHRSRTARALMANVPPVATPLGAMMFAAGCGVAFTDWYISEGGREGARKLQGFRALDAAHEDRRGREMLNALEAFMPRARDLDWDVQAAVRPLAEAAITVLRQRFDIPDGPIGPRGV